VNRIVAGVDLGGTHIVSAVVDEKGRVLGRDKRPTLALSGPRAVLLRIADCVRTAATISRVPFSRIRAVGVGSPGPLDPDRGIILYSENLRWKNVHLKAYLERALKKTVFVENDANVAALGEVWMGAGKGGKVVLCLTLGTGVGGGLILDGNIYRGAWDVGCEIGHIVVDPRGPSTRYGNRGVLEQYVSATGIVRMAKEEGIGPPRGKVHLEALDVQKLACRGEPKARKVFREAGRMLGVGLTTALHLLNPSLVIFAGGVSKAGEMLYGPMRRELKRRCFRASLDGVKFRLAKLGDNMGVVGAARLAFQKMAKP
jgi:glucokinase